MCLLLDSLVCRDELGRVRSLDSYTHSKMISFISFHEERLRQGARPWMSLCTRCGKASHLYSDVTVLCLSVKINKIENCNIESLRPWGEDLSGPVFPSLHLPRWPSCCSDCSEDTPACSFGPSLQCPPWESIVASPSPRSGFHSEAGPAPTLCVTHCLFCFVSSHMRTWHPGRELLRECHWHVRALVTPRLVV